MKKTILVVLVVLVPLLLFINVFQAVHSYNLQQKLASLQEDEARLLEENKRILASIAVLRSAERIAYIAEGSEELQILDPERIIRIAPVDGNASANSASQDSSGEYIDG